MKSRWEFPDKGSLEITIPDNNPDIMTLTIYDLAGKETGSITGDYHELEARLHALLKSRTGPERTE